MEEHLFINSFHCKDCKSFYDKKWYVENRERRLMLATAYDHSPAGIAAKRKNNLKQAKVHRSKWNARQNLHYHIKVGHILKPDNCLHNNSECEGKLEAHHHLGYEGGNWKNVRWLCHKHHRIEEGRWVA